MIPNYFYLSIIMKYIINRRKKLVCLKKYLLLKKIYLPLYVIILFFI
jgi:hypothetical protein